MGVASIGGRSRRFVAVTLAFIGLVVLTLVALARADGSPNIGVAVSSSSTLYGDPVAVTLSASNPQGQPYGYNLSYRVVLPAGVSYAGGGPVAPRQIADAPEPGETTLIFANSSDLSPGATKSFGFNLQYDSAVYDAGDSFPVKAQAFVNDDPRFIPKFDAEGIPQGPGGDSFTGFTPEVTGIQTLKAIEVEIDEPSPEGEILRGVHDHQTVYTLKVTNNGINPTTGTVLDAYIPAGLEFLGCGGTGADHTTDAPTNPGSAEEYPGSGPIEVEPLAGCVEPQSVETELVDPDGPGPLPEAIYTHVVWPVGELADGETQLFPYRAAVPIRANTNNFSGARPSAASGGQATNLDNNDGPEVTDETLLRTYAKASGTYQGKAPTPTSDEQVLDRTAEDWVVHKSGSSGTLAQGAITTWTLRFETSEYKFTDDATVTDTLPDGLCPLGPTNLIGGDDPADLECDPVPGQEPSAPYASATENADGTWTLTWDSGSLAKLGHTGISDEFTITFPTKTRTHYQENFEAVGPILAHDRIDNSVTTDGRGFARCTAPGTPDCSTPGPKIDFDGGDGATIVDASHAEQEAGAPAILKQVAAAGPNCQAATYTNEVPHYSPGDRVCWRLRVDFPGTLDTSPQALSDFLPAGAEYLAGSDEAGPQNNVSATIDDSGADAGLLTWTVSGSTVPAGGEVFERFITTVAQPSGIVQAGDLTGNLFKFSSENTAEETFPQRAEAEYVLDIPEVDLVKGVEQIDRGGSTVDGPNGPNVDDKTVEASDEVTYRVDVTNSGAQDATGVEVWDVLPAEYPCSAIAEISDGGECVEGSPATRVVWILPGLAKAGGTKKLTYVATVPSDIGPARTLVNNAGVTQFGGETNTGELFTYTPADNIDPNNETTPNAPAADDPSSVKTAGATIVKAQATEVEEGGNNLATQATIGEKVKYTLTATIPEGTTLGGNAEITDTVSSIERLSYVAGSASATLNGVADPVLKINASGPTPKLLFPSGYANAPGSGNDVVVLSFEMVVTDIAASTRLAGGLTNQAALKWTDPATGAQSLPSNTTSAQIVEPLISQAKTDDVNPGRVQPGQIVTFTVTTTNSNAANVSTAHDLEIVDTVPLGLIPVGPAPGNLPLADGDPVPLSGGAIWDADTRTIAKTVATLNRNASSAFSYRVEVEKPAVAGASFTNEVEATTASLGEAFSGRRTTGSGYAASAEDTIRLGGASIAKQVSPGEATPGQALTYTLRVTIPANVELFDATVVDRLPAGVEFDGYVAETCLSGCPLANPINRYDFAPQPDGSAKLAWDLGDIPALSQAQEIELTYDAHLRRIDRGSGGGEVVAGDTEVNTATVGSNLSHKGGPFDPESIPDEFDEDSPAAEASLDVVEPALSFDKRIKVGAGSFGDGPTAAHSDDQLTYQLVVANEGSSPAYDVIVDDSLDPALTDVQVVPQGGVVLDTPWSPETNSMSFSVPGPIAPGTSVTIEYTARFVAASELSDGQAVANVAEIYKAFGLPQAHRVTHQSWEFVAYPAGPDSAEAVLDFPGLGIEKTTGLAGNPDAGDAEIKQPFPWRIVVSNSSATAGASAVEVADVLPRNWKYVAGSTAVSDGSTADPEITTGGPGGDRLAWTIASLGPEESVTIAFEAEPLLAAADVPGMGAEAHVNGAAVAAALDEAGNSGNAEGPYSTPPDFAKATLRVPQLALEKTPDGGGATAGEDSSFTIEVSNDGDGVARNVKVKDVLPAGLAYVAATATATPATGFSETAVSAGPGAGETTIEWAIAEIPGSSSVQIELPVKVAAGVADGTTLTNTAAATSDEETTPVDDEGSLEVGTEADVAIEKTGAAGYTAGDNYTWQLRVRNLGPSVARSAVVSDPLPAGTEFVSATAPCTHAAGEVECELGDLAAGFDQTYGVTVAVDPGTTASPLSNTATVETETDDPDPDNNESTFGPTAGSLADVWVEKTVSEETILRKQQTTFTLVVGNDGPSVARDVALEDVLPAGLEFVSTDEPPCVFGSGEVGCIFGDLAPGAEETVHVTVKGIVNGEHDNVATVDTTTPEPPDGKPNEDEATVIVGPVADLGLEKTGPATVAADGQLTWTLKATNNGEDPATGVRIADPLPAGTEFVSADAGCTLASGTVTCEIGNLADGESAERQITVTVPRALADTLVVNSATVKGNEGDDEPGNDSDEAATEVGPSADVSIVKTGPARVNANGTLTWTLAVANAGPSAATGVTVKDALPAGVELTAATPTQGACAGAVECQLGTLPKGAAAQIQVTVRVPAALEGSSLLNSAAAAAAEPDPVPENNESKATTVVDPPAPSDYDLAISKTVDGSGKPNVGDTVDYEIAVANRGPATATGVKIVDALPAALEYAKATVPGGKCAQKSGVVTCSVPSLAAGAEVRARVTARVMKEGTVKNTATVSAAVADADPNNNKSSAKVSANLGKTKLKVKKTRVGKGSVEAGDRIKYKIRVTNLGAGPAAEVVVCDRLPSKLAFVKLAGAELRKGDACWEIDLLAAGASKAFRLTTRVDGGVNGGGIRNVAYVKSANAPRSQGVAGVRVKDSGPGRAGGVTG